MVSEWLSELLGQLGVLIDTLFQCCILAGIMTYVSFHDLVIDERQRAE